MGATTAPTAPGCMTFGLPIATPTARFQPKSISIKGKSMTSPTAFRSPYEKRVDLVKQTLMSASTLDDDLAAKLAVRVLHTLDSIPEKSR